MRIDVIAVIHTVVAAKGVALCNPYLCGKGRLLLWLYEWVVIAVVILEVRYGFCCIIGLDIYI
jgi:hypothetical protein